MNCNTEGNRFMLKLNPHKIVEKTFKKKIKRKGVVQQKTNLLLEKSNLQTKFLDSCTTHVQFLLFHENFWRFADSTAVLLILTFA